MTALKTEFLKYRDNETGVEQLYEVIPPAPTENDRGGIIALPRTDSETVEAKLGEDGKLYVPEGTKDYNQLENVPTKLSDFENDLKIASSWNDLEDKPEIPSIEGLATTVELQTAKDELNESISGKADAIHEHSYNDLEDRPTKLSEFENDLNFVVTITSNGNTYSADKTFNEIKTADEAGMNVTAISSTGMPCELAGINGTVAEFYFSVISSGVINSTIVAIMNIGGTERVVESTYSVEIGDSANLNTEASTIVEAINEVNTKASEKADSVHTHDEYALVDHNHDEHYSSIEHVHSYNDLTDLPFGEINVRNVLFATNTLTFKYLSGTKVYRAESTPIYATEIIEDGKTYDVVWDGVKYTGLTPHLVDGGHLAIGATIENNVADFSEYPFAITTSESASDDGIIPIVVLTNSEGDTHTITIYSTSIETVKISDEYQHQSDWDEGDVNSAAYVKNKPFYNEKVVYVDWDVNTEGLVTATVSSGDVAAYKICDYISETDIIGAEMTEKLRSGYNIGTIYAEDIQRYDDALYGVNDLIFCSENNHTFEDITFPETGVYIGAYNINSSLVNIKIENTRMKTLDEQYLPDTIARVSYVDENFARKSDIGNIDLSDYESKEDAQAKYDELSSLVSIQADWNITDELNAGFIKNKTHYIAEKYEEIFADSIYSSMYSDYAPYCQWLNKPEDFLVVGDTYKVVYNEIEQIVTCKLQNGDYPYLGNLSVNSDGEDTGESFLIMYMGTGFEHGYSGSFVNGRLRWYHPSTISGGSTGYIYHLTNEVHQLDEKYIPDTIARQLDVNSALALKADSNHNHDSVYETKEDAQAKLDEAKAYTDEQIENHTHSWNELNDKPFGELDSVLFDGNITGASSYHAMKFDGVLLQPLVSGQEYTFELNGYKFTEVAYLYNDFPMLGQPYLYDGNYSSTHSGENYCITNGYENHFNVYTNANILGSDTQNLYFKIYTNETKNIDEQYIPDTIARTQYVDEQLATKASTEHNHDDQYYTETEIDTKLETKANIDHNHDNKYYTQAQIDSMEFITIDDIDTICGGAPANITRIASLIGGVV